MKREFCAVAALVSVVACAPREADYALSERARDAPAPTLAPTASFDAPLEGGIAASVRLEAEREALAARAAALRARGATLSQGAVVDAEARARLEAAAAR